MTAPPMPLEEAQARLLALAAPLPVEHADVAGTLGRYLARPLVARRTSPACDLSAMDGYAVTGDGSVGPWRVIGESAAGHPYAGRVGPGEAVRISTGAALPGNAGSVILQEDLARSDGVVALAGTLPDPPAKHIRRQGMDFSVSEVLLDAGTRIGPAQMALAISAGHAHLPVRRMVRLAVLDTGDELSDDAENCPPHQVPAGNGVMLAAMASAEPCEIIRLGPVADDLDALVTALGQAAECDVIVTSGGASVGDHDLVRPALAAWGAEIDFWRIAIKPGKPLLFATRDGVRGRQVILGLPGNPVSTHVTAFLFLLPLLRALSGSAVPLPARGSATLAAPLAAGGARREFIRARRDDGMVAPLANQDSSALATLARANALIDRAAQAPGAGTGDPVAVFSLENGGVA